MAECAGSFLLPLSIPLGTKQPQPWSRGGTEGTEPGIAPQFLLENHSLRALWCLVLFINSPLRQGKVPQPNSVGLEGAGSALGGGKGSKGLKLPMGFL